MVIKGDKRVALEKSKFQIETEIEVSNATKILGVSSIASIVQVENSQGEVRAKCRVVNTLLYLGEDKNAIKSEEASGEQYVTIRNSFLEAGSVTQLNLVVEDTEYVGNNRIKIRSSLELRGFAYKQVAFEACESGGDIIVRDAPVMAERVVPIPASEIVAGTTHSIKEQIDSILTTNTSVIVNNVSTATETCAISGECHTYITYLSSGVMQSRCLVTPFETEVIAPGISGSDKAYCKGIAGSTSVGFEGTDGEVKTEITIKLVGFAMVYEEVNLVTDCYSKEKEIKASYDELSFQQNTCIASSVEKLSGTFRIQEGDKRIRSVLAVIGAGLGSPTTSTEGGLAVEGVFKGTAIYIDEDDAIASVKLALPYRFVLDRNFTCKDSLESQGCVLCASARARHNDEIDITADVSFDVIGTEEKRLKYLKGIEVIGDKPKSDAVISLYYVGDGEGLWDVAKALSTDEDTLMALNPDITLPLKNGDKVLLYNN